MKKIGWIILVFLLFSNCAVNKLKYDPYKRINYKQTHTQPHQSYSDKPTRMRALNVRGHAHHFSYKIKRSESYGK